MIRSAHIIGSQESGGAERFYMRLLRALHRREQPVLAINRAGSAVARELGQAIPQAHLPLRNVFDLWSMWRIRRLVAAHRAQIVQTYMGRATRLTRLPRQRNSVHVARLGGFYKLAGYRHADAWVGNTKEICDYLVGNGFAPARVFYVGNFVEVGERVCLDARAPLLQRFAIPADAWLVLGIGRLINKKGFADLLQAFAAMPADVAERPAHLLIVGEGPQREALQQQAHQLGVAARVHWAGWQNDPSAFYRAADLFVCASLHEPLGNVILEAWGYGLPVVSTDTHGARELASAGENAILVPCAKPAALAAAMTELLRAPDEARTSLGAAGKQCVVQHYSEQAIVDAYLDLYQRLL